MKIVVTRYVNDQPAHRHVRFEHVKSAKINRVINDVYVEEHERLERGKPIIYRDLRIGNTFILYRKLDTGSRIVVFVGAE